ncbi:MAG: glycosyltransferase [Bacteroidetes bacterium]|nr:MAG: glycosyltransferase [Bacteroidota bacterium]
MKILFLHPYPAGEAPSQRFRFEQYLHFLEQNGHIIHRQSFLDEKTWQILYQKGYKFKKIFGILIGFLRRIKILFGIKKYDYVFIHREATPLGYPFVEYLITKFWKKKIIFDFDDAIWLENTSQENKLVSRLKFHQKTNLICRWAYKISAGNQYLVDYAKQFNQNVVLNPTTIDTQNLHNTDLYSVKKDKIFTIGWTGTHSTLFYLDFLWDILKELEQKYTFRMIVIANQKPDIDLKSLQFINWNKKTEIEDLLKMDIGLMPLTDDKWANGKCGFKALQYMSLGIPTIASPVGVNVDIIQHNENGFLCATKQEWKDILIMFLEKKIIYQQIASKTKQTIVQKYSVLSNKTTFEGLFF